MADMISLKENRDFRRLYGKGKSFVSPVVVTYLMKNRCKQVRYGITTSKKIGKAVQRNRSRRVIREAFRLLSPRTVSYTHLDVYKRQPYCFAGKHLFSENK